MSASQIFLHPRTRADLHNAVVMAGLRPIIVQTRGGAEQSAGTHGTAGYYNKVFPFSACIDWSVNQDADRIDPHTLKNTGKVVMGDKQIQWWLWKLGQNNIAAFYRREWEGFTARHIHGISVAVHIGIPLVQHQVVDWLTGKDGLKSHNQEKYWQPPPQTEDNLKETFLAFNPECRSWF